MDVKPGIKTTEFWGTLIGGLWAALAPAFLPGATALQQAVPAAVAAVYTLARAIVKVKAAPPNQVGLRANGL